MSKTDESMKVSTPADSVSGMADTVEIGTPTGETESHLDFSSVQPGLAQRVAGGGFWALISQAVKLATALLVIPYVIRKLGSEDYGLLALVNVIIGYVACADLGMGLASTKFGTEALASRDEKAEAAAVWTCILITFLPVCAGTGAIFLAARPLTVRLFRLPLHLQDSAVQAIRLGTLTVWALVLGSILNTPQLTRLRFRTNSCIEVCVGLLQSCVLLAVLVLGGRVAAAVAAGAFAATIGVVVHLAVSSRLCPRLLRPRFEPSLFRPLLRFGLAVIAGVAVGSLVGQGERLLLVRWGSTRDLAHYSIAMTIAGLLVLVPNALAQPLMPSFVKLLTSSQRDRIERLYNHMLAGIVLMTLPIALLICISARPFLTRWAGAEFGSASVIPLYILIAGMLVKAASYVPGALLIALGRVDLMPKFQTMELIPYSLLLLALIARFGIGGAAIAWSLRTVAESVLTFIAAGRLAGIRQRPLAANPLDYCLAVLALVVPVFAAWALVPGQFSVLSAAVVAVGCYATIVFQRIATAEERAWFRNWIQNLLR